MLNESEATRLWRQLFRGQAVTSLTLAEAKLVVEAMPLESPLRQRYSIELEELRALRQTPRLTK
jgi:hypothetical protein